MASPLNPLYNARNRREFQGASERYGTSRFSPEMLELYELQRKMIAERSAPQGTATSQPVESRDDIIRRKMLEYNAPPDPSQSQPESIDQWTRIRNYLGDQLTTGQDSPYPVEDARPATPGDYAEQGPAYQQQFRDALAREDAPAPPPPAPFSMGAIPELTAQGAQVWKERVDAIERAGQPIDTSPEAQASRRRNRALSEIGAQSPQKAAEVAALLENTRPATIANTIPQSDLPSGADMIALQGLTPIADAATFLPRMAAKMLPGDEPQFSKDYLNMADLREFNEQVPSRSAVEGAGRLASGLGGEVGAFFVPGAMPVQKGVANLTSRMAARALPTSSKVLAGARNLGAGVVGFELPHYAETVLGGGAHGEAAMNPLGAPFRLVRDVLGDVSGSLDHPGVINVMRNAGYYADMTPESLDLLRRNLAPATILALPMALHKMGDAGKAKAAEIKDALKSGDPARVQKAVSDMDAPMRDQVARTADDLITLQRTITPPPMPLAPGTQMPQGGRVVRLGEVVGDREAGQMERAGFIAPSDAAQNVPSAEVPPASLTDALNRARQYGPPRPPKPPSEGATDEASARTSQPEGAQGGEATPRLEGAGPPQAARPQQGSRLEALAAGTPINTVNGMTLAARFNEWLESRGRPIVRSQAEFLEWLDRPRADNRPPAEDPSAPSMTEQFLAWAQKNPSTIQPPAPTQSPQAPAPTLKDRMAAMRMNPVPEKPGGFSLTAALRARMVGAEVKPPMSTPETPITAETPVAPEAKPAAKPVASETKPTESAPRAKEPWEMTRAEYSKSGPFLPERGATETRGQLGGEFVDRSIYIHEEMFAKLSPGVKRYGVSPREAVVMHERMHDVWEQAVGQATVGGNEIWKITIQELEKIPKSTGVDVIGKRSMVERAVETLTVDSLAPERLSTAERAWASKVKALAHKNEVATALSAGRAVPPEVLKDYPDLAAKYASQAAPASEQVPPFTPDTPRGSVYRIRFKDKGEMYAVRESDNPRGGGDPIFESLADARKHAEGLPERDRVAQEQRESREAAAREKAEQETAAKAKRENLSGFGDDLPPMKKALAVKVLDAQVRSDGKVYKLRDLIAEKVQEGFTVEENSSHDAAARKKLEAEFGRIAQTAPIGNENHPQTQRYLELKKNLADPSFPQKTTRVLSHPDGRVNDSFNKTALDYAEHLIKARNESPARRPGDVETTPRPATEKTREGVTTEAVRQAQAERPQEGLLTPKPPAQGDTNRPSAQGEPPHFAVYNDKVIPMDYIPDPKQQFRFAGQRIIDNNAEGFVVTPKGEVFSITKGSRRAKPVTGEAKQVALDKVASYQSARPAAPRETVVKVSDLPKFIVGGKSFDTLPKARKEAIRRVEMGPSRVYQVASVERAPKMSFSPASWLREFADAVPGFKGNPVFVEKGGKLHYNDGQGGTYDINPTWLGITRPLNAGEQVRVDFSKGEAPAPREVPVGGKGLVTDAGDVARVEAAKEVIKKAVKDSQSRLGTLGGTLEPYFNREFARAVGDIASIYTKAVMKQGYAQLLEYTDAAFGRFKEFLATHLPEHADVLGRVQGGKFLRRVWARAVASQKDLKGLGMAEKKAAMRAREAFVTGEKVERGRVSLRKAMGAARRDAERPMISLELSHGLTPEMVKRIRGEDRIDALRAMDEVANPIGEIGGVQEALRALEKNGGKIRNLSPQQIDTLAAVAETFSRVSENARAMHKDGKILDVDEFAVEGAGDVMKDKPFDLDRRPITGRIARALGLKKRGSEDPFETDAELRENAMGILRYIHDGASEPYQMVENFFGRGSKVYDWFFNSKEGMRGGDTLAKEAEMKARDPVEKVLVETGLNRETEEAKFRFEKRKYRAGSQELTLTGSEALDLYNHLRASGGNGKRIEENGFKLFTKRNRKDKTELTDQDAQSFVDNVPENIRRLSDAMMESGRTLHGYWARMYERIFGVRAGDRGPNYWSIMTDTSMRRSQETTLDKYLPTGDLVDSPFTKARAEMTGEPMLITDGLAKWRSMVTQQSRYAGLAEPILKMRSIVNHPEVRDAMTRKYGQKVLDKFNLMLELQSGFRDRVGGPEVAGVNKWIKDKTTSVTGPLLSGSLRAQVMSNLTGSLQYMKEADGKDFNTAVFGLAKDIWAGRYGELRESLKENGYLHNRLDTPTRRLATPAEWRGLDPTEHKVVEVLNRMNDWIGKNFAGRWDDLNTVLAYKIAEAKAAREGRNLSRSDLLTEAEKLVRLTQNPSSLFDMSVTAADARETWWGSMYFFIQNGALKARSSLERSIHKGGTEAVKGIALAGLETLGGRIAQTAQWAATALPFMADNDKRKDPGRVAESNLAQAVAEVVDLIVPGAGIAVRQAHAAWHYNKAPNFSPLADVQQAMVQVGGTVWGGVAEAMGLRKDSKTPTSRKLYKATLELLRAMAPFYKIPPQFMTPLREAMREKPARKPFR